MDDKIKEECGIFGIYDFDLKDVSISIYHGLVSLQHRGQESCGIAVTKTYGEKDNICVHKGMGLVTEVFKQSNLSELNGNLGIGHVRYSTTGDTTIKNAQPLVLNYIKGTLSLAHNGNLVNTSELKQMLGEAGAIFHTTTDSELIALLIAKERIKTNTVEEAILNAAKYIKGAYGLVISSPQKLIGVRDPLGIKPLCLGKLYNSYIITSESCAITSLGGTLIRDIEPGEILTITKDGLSSNKTLQIKKRAHCVFEYIYFARTDSKLDNVSVYQARIKAGMALAKEYPVIADMVCGVPESGTLAALGYSDYSKIPYAQIFNKNSYIGRTFIKPTQTERESSVQLKLNLILDIVKDKRIIIVDDSIVRGTTMAKIIKLLKNAGAKEVHVRISSPAFLYPCYYGTDIPSNKQLIASSHSSDEICKIIGADSLGYLKIDDLDEMTSNIPLCKACFNNDYPIK